MVKLVFVEEEEVEETVVGPQLYQVILLPYWTLTILDLSEHLLDIVVWVGPGDDGKVV